MKLTDALAPDARTWDDGRGRTVLWGPRTGRSVTVSAAEAEAIASGTLSEGLRARLAERGLLGPVDVDRWVVCRSRWPLYRPDTGALWAPVPSVNTAGGPAWRAIPLDVAEAALWSAINDRRTVAELVARFGPGVSATLRAWCDPDVQAVSLRPKAPPPGDPSLVRIVAAPRDANVRTADQRDAAGATTLGAWHHRIDDAGTHFDDVETTVAHVFGEPHPALGGQSYGERLREKVGAAARVVEVGCGDGAVAAAFSGGAGGARYLRIDLSPDLLAAQARRAPGTAGALGDATALPLRDGSVDLLLSNEVLADLRAAPWDTDGPVAARVRRYGLSMQPDGTDYNLGAWAFVEEIARVLAPGGRAWVSEFGDADEVPTEAVQLDHPEVSIHFGHLVTIARRLGLRADLERLDVSLGFDPTATWLWRPHHMALRAMFRAEGRHFAARARTPADLAAACPWPVEGIRWVPLHDEGPGPTPTRFTVLRLQRAAAPSPRPTPLR